MSHYSIVNSESLFRNRFKKINVCEIPGFMIDRLVQVLCCGETRPLSAEAPVKRDIKSWGRTRLSKDTSVVVLGSWARLANAAVIDGRESMPLPPRKHGQFCFNSRSLDDDDDDDDPLILRESLSHSLTPKTLSIPQCCAFSGVYCEPVHCSNLFSVTE